MMKEWELIYISQKIFGDLRLILDEGHDDPRFLEIMEQYDKKIPLAKIFQEKHFWKSVFKTTNDTLDPRPESELIIETLLKKFSKDSVMHILDLGTGTGALILSILKEFPLWTGVAIDSCPKALKVAKYNCDKMEIQNRCSFLQNNWLENIEKSMPMLKSGRYFDICISNPPYILEKEETFAPFDPPLSLFSPSILYFYEKIKDKIFFFDYLLLEINHKYGSEYKKLFPNGQILQYNHYDRCLWVKNKAK